MPWSGGIPFERAYGQPTRVRESDGISSRKGFTLAGLMGSSGTTAGPGSSRYLLLLLRIVLRIFTEAARAPVRDTNQNGPDFPFSPFSPEDQEEENDLEAVHHGFTEGRVSPEFQINGCFISKRVIQPEGGAVDLFHVGKQSSLHFPFVASFETNAGGDVETPIAFSG